MGLEQAARDALELATVEPAAARELGGPVLDAARAAGDWASASIAARALGVAAFQLGELDAAVGQLRSSVAAGRRAGSRRRVAEARMSLASALAVSGRPRQAFRQMDAALRDLDGLAAARALTQRSAILQELDRVEEALEDLRRALPVLRREGDAQWVVRALSNRGLAYADRQAFAQAEADFTAARRLCDQHGLALAGVRLEQNLGYVRTLRGDVPAALHHLNLSEQGYRELGVVGLGAVLADRAELLLSVRLVREARAAAEAAVAEYERQHRQVNLPDALLLLSSAALLGNDPGTALRAAEDATRMLRGLGRPRVLPLARHARLQAQLAADPGSVRPAEARRVAAGLRAAGWTVPALEAQILAGLLALRRGRRGPARADLAAASRARRSGPADARSRAWLAAALLRQADGDRRGAAAALRAGLRVLEDYRATLGATELRAHVSVHRGALARLGLRMAVQDRRPREVLAWAERTRASALLLRPVTPPEDAVLDRDLSDLRATTTQLADLRAAGLPAEELVQRQVRLEQRIRDRCREVPGAAGPFGGRPDPRTDPADGLGDLALVEYVELDGQLYAVTVVAGRARLHELGPTAPIAREMDHLPFALHRLAGRNTRPASRAAATAVLRRAATTLDERLTRPLRRRLGDRPVLLVPSASLHSVPWSVVPSYADRPVLVSPSATLWQLARRVPVPPAGSAAPVVVAAGPGLPGAEAEAAGIAALYPGALRLTGAAASSRALSAAMDGAGLVHLAAHGTVRADNPLFSSIGMADGPFTVYDLERLRRAPGQVVLAACDAGRSHVLAGEEILGFAAALLAAGTATLVAPVLPVPDAETAPLMLAYHRHLRAGVAPAEALCRAQGEVRSDDPVASAGAASFVCLGAGLARA